MIDIHTHILPGLDDGAKTLEESIQMVRQAEDIGVSVICATPHIMDGVGPWLEEQIIRSFRLLHSQLVKRKIAVKLILGSEIYIRYDMESLRRFKFFSLNQTDKYVLMELPGRGLSASVGQLIRGLKLEGITVIIAHPERCFVHKDELPEIEKLIQAGALIQINAGSILGHFGKQARKIAENLLEQNLVHFVASDAHNPSSASITVLSLAFEKLSQLVGKEKTEELVIHNPSQMLAGKSLWSWEKDMTVGEKPAFKEADISEISP